MRRSTKTIRALAATLALALAATACAPGGSTTDDPAASSSASPVSKDVSAAGDVTLTVWDQNTDTGINDAQDELNKQFQQKYPNVKIERVSRSFADLKTTLKLALTSKDPPDVVQANQGYPDMGSFVSGGLLRPEDDYAKLYGWDTYYPEQQLNINKFSADGKDWQSGNLYGVSQTGEIVGVYYNRKILKDLNLAGAEDDHRVRGHAADHQGVRHAADRVRRRGEEPRHPYLRHHPGRDRRRAGGDRPGHGPERGLDRRAVGEGRADHPGLGHQGLHHRGRQRHLP